MADKAEEQDEKITFKVMLKIMWECWCEIVGLAFATYLVCFFIFGGEFSFQINWHSLIDLLKHFKR